LVLRRDVSLLVSIGVAGGFSGAGGTDLPTLGMLCQRPVGLARVCRRVGVFGLTNVRTRLVDLGVWPLETAPTILGQISLAIDSPDREALAVSVLTPATLAGPDREALAVSVLTPVEAGLARLVCSAAEGSVVGSAGVRVRRIAGIARRCEDSRLVCSVAEGDVVGSAGVRVRRIAGIARRCEDSRLVCSVAKGDVVGSGG